MQQGPLDPERAAVLTLRAWRASLLNPRVMCWMIRRKGAWGVAVPRAALNTPALPWAALTPELLA